MRASNRASAIVDYCFEAEYEDHVSIPTFANMIIDVGFDALFLPFFSLHMKSLEMYWGTFVARLISISNEVAKTL